MADPRSGVAGWDQRRPTQQRSGGVLSCRRWAVIGVLVAWAALVFVHFHQNIEPIVPRGERPRGITHCVVR